LLVVVATLATACGGSGKGDPGPTGEPAAVVAAAPDITLSAGTARVVGAAPGINATGTVRFGDAEPTLTRAGADRDKPAPFGVLEPIAVLDLLRGVVSVDPYGGAQVQGIGTKRYELDIDLAKAILATPAARRGELLDLDGRLGSDNRVWADVFIDSAGRVRRVLLPVRAASDRPYGDDKNIPQLVSGDYSDFGGDQ
jgi:hypothetical protein